MARWATVDEAAEYLRVHKNTLYNEINKKKGVGLLFREGPRLVIDLDEADELLKKDDLDFLTPLFQYGNRTKVRATLAKCLELAARYYEDSVHDIWDSMGIYDMDNCEHPKAIRVLDTYVISRMNSVDGIEDIEKSVAGDSK